ncbi:MAG: DUF2891 domain-containing protein, partial [Aquaticitalea sp.]
MKFYSLLLFVSLFLNCNSPEKKADATPPAIEIAKTPILNLEEANRLAKLPIACIQTEYPNKLNQTIGSNEDLKSPKT